MCHGHQIVQRNRDTAVKRHRITHELYVQIGIAKANKSVQIVGHACRCVSAREHMNGTASWLFLSGPRTRRGNGEGAWMHLLLGASHLVANLRGRHHRQPHHVELAFALASQALLGDQSTNNSGSRRDDSDNHDPRRAASCRRRCLASTQARLGHFGSVIDASIILRRRCPRRTLPLVGR